MKIFRRRAATAPGGGTGVAVRSRLDRMRDAFTPQRIRLAAQGIQRRIGLTTAGQLALLAAVAAWVVARIIAGTPLFIFAYGAFLLVVAGYLLSPRRLRMAGNRAGLYPRAQQGDRLDVTVKLETQRRVGTFILEEYVPERLGQTVKVPITGLGAGREVDHRYSLRCTRRGVYEIGPLVAVTSDPLGLTQREHVLAERFELLVHPRMEEVQDRPLTRQFEDPPIRPPRSKPFPSGLEFYGMREYKPGDDLRRVVWRASARVGKLMVREAEQGITDRITIMLDTDRGHHSHEGEYSESFETAVSAAASLAARHLRDGYEIRLEGNAGPLIRPVRGRAGQLPVLDALTRVDTSREPLTTMITRLVADPRRDAHNVLITPRLSVTETAQLRLLLQKGISLLIVALMWRDDSDETLNAATALGSQVAAIHPGQDLAAALYHDIGAGSR